MTSSVISKLNISRRRLLYLSAQKATIYHWQNGELGSSYLFDVNDEGRINFERYLREAPNTLMYIMVDVFEEEFRRDTIPHVFGHDRAAIMERKKSRLFRDTPYMYTAVQGRETTGRRDDRVFLSAITNPAVVDQWTALLDKYKVPLAGIHSLPLFTENIIGDIPDASDHMLVVSMQSISGLRQTFFQNREFRISRLVQLPRYGTVPYAPYVEEEIEKIRRYLSSLRLVSQDKPLDIYFLLAGGLLDEMETHYEDSSLTHYHFLDINDLAGKAGFSLNLNTPFSDQYFASQFLKKRQQNFYGSSTDLRYATLRRIRLSTLAVSIFLIVSAFVWGGINFMGGLTLKQSSLAAESKAHFYQTRYDIARGRLPKTPVEPDDLKVAVEIAAELDKHKATPLEMIQTISKGLDQFPSVRLNTLQWMASMDPEMKISKNGMATVSSNNVRRNPVRGTGARYTQLNSTDKKYLYYQIALVDGHLEPFDGDFRKAIDTINAFAETLKSLDAVHEVKVVSLPLDVSPDANLQGNTSVVKKEAKFTLRIVVGIRDAS